MFQQERSALACGDAVQYSGAIKRTETIELALGQTQAYRVKIFEASERSADRSFLDAREERTVKPGLGKLPDLPPDFSQYCVRVMAFTAERDHGRTGYIVHICAEAPVDETIAVEAGIERGRVCLTRK